MESFVPPWDPFPLSFAASSATAAGDDSDGSVNGVTDAFLISEAFRS